MAAILNSIINLGERLLSKRQGLGVLLLLLESTGIYQIFFQIQAEIAVFNHELAFRKPSDVSRGVIVVQEIEIWGFVMVTGIPSLHLSTHFA